MEDTNVLGTIVLIGIFVFPIILAICLYNRLVRVKNQVQYALSAIDVYLKKRFDLIPN
ncbi:MAG: LemA family protein, partial [Nitrospirae bacterium]